MKFKLILAALLTMFVGSITAQEMPQLPPIPVDTAIRMGKLDNGLTYYVRRNNWPENRVNFYIAQRVGSVQEDDSQRGLAHFLEHMAFNGTEHFPGKNNDGVVDYTRKLGVEFGGDMKAYTGTDQTVYRICNVPNTRQSALDSCLLIIKDWSNGLLLEGDEIDKERGVIHEEWRLRSSAAQRMFERNLTTLYPDSKYGHRMPIGLMEVVDNFKYDEIRNYYKKWYRPDNQAVIVVGDINVDYTVNKIKELFGPIPKPAADAAQVVDIPVPDNAEAIVVVDKDKEQPYSMIQLMYKHDVTPREEKANMAYLLEEYVVNMVSAMLNNRFSEISQDPDCPYTQAGCGDDEYIMSKTKDAFSFYAIPKEGKNVETLKRLTEEALRAAKHGFTATEYLRARDEFLSQLEKAYNNRNQTNNSVFGDAMRDNYLLGEPLPSIEMEYTLYKQLAPMIAVENINELMPQLIQTTDTNLVVLNFNPDKEGVLIPTAQQLKGAVDAAQAENLEAWVDNVKNEPLMAELPKPGKIVKETENKQLGYKVLTLSNGATAIIKHTDFKDDEIIMEAESKGGSSLYGESDWANTELFDAIISASGLGNFTNNELEKALAGKQASASLSLSTSYERVSGKSTVKDLETMFQLTHLNFTAIKKDEKSVSSIMGMLENMLKNKHAQPEAVFSDSVSYTLGNHDWRSKPFDADDLKKINYDRVLQIAKERTANAGDFTFYFVGNFDEAILKGYIEQYIASLPANGVKENYRNVTQRPTGNLVNRFNRKMETPKAIAVMTWYTDKSAYTLENNVKASMAGQVLDFILLQKIREDASAAYSASGQGNVSRIGDKVFTSVVGYCPMKPEKSDIALKIMREEVPGMVKEVSADYLAKIKETMLKDADTDAKNNNHWVYVLNTHYTHGIDMQTDYKKAVSAVTTKDISNFVRDVILKGGSHVEVIMLPEE